MYSTVGVDLFFTWKLLCDKNRHLCLPPKPQVAWSFLRNQLRRPPRKWMREHVRIYIFNGSHKHTFRAPDLIGVADLSRAESPCSIHILRQYISWRVWPPTSTHETRHWVLHDVMRTLYSQETLTRTWCELPRWSFCMRFIYWVRFENPTMSKHKPASSFFDKHQDWSRIFACHCSQLALPSSTSHRCSHDGSRQQRIHANGSSFTKTTLTKVCSPISHGSARIWNRYMTHVPIIRDCVPRL